MDAPTPKAKQPPMYLGLDIGTTATKGVLVDDGHAVIASAHVGYNLHQPTQEISEFDPQAWIDAICAVAGALRAKEPTAFQAVQAIGLSGQMHSLVALDVDGRPVRPAILWNDGRGVAEARLLRQAVPNVGTLTGVLPMASFTAAKLLWLREYRANEFARIAHVLWVKDYVRHWLTGEFATDMSDAAGSLLFDQANRCWADAVVDYVGLQPRALPRILEGTERSGTLGRSAAAELGLPANIPVAAGGGDTPVGALGLGCVNQGDAFISLGTGTVFVTVQESYQPRPESLLHTFAHCVPHRWYQMAAMLNGASCLAWVSQLVGSPDVGSLVRRTEERAGGPSRVLFAPYLRGERTPHDDALARGAFVGLDAACGPTDLAQAVLEGVAFSLRQGQDLFADETARTRAVGLIGGGSRSPYWNRLTASILDRPLHLFADADVAGAVGAVRLAMLMTGHLTVGSLPAWPVSQVVEPQPELVAAYAERYHLFRELYPALRPFTQNVN